MVCTITLTEASVLTNPDRQTRGKSEHELCRQNQKHTFLSRQGRILVVTFSYFISDLFIGIFISFGLTLPKKIVPKTSLDLCFLSY